PPPPAVLFPLSLHDALPICLTNGVYFTCLSRDEQVGCKWDSVRLGETEVVSHTWCEKDALLSPADRPTGRGRIGGSLASVQVCVDRKSTRLNSSHVSISYAV